MSIRRLFVTLSILSLLQSSVRGDFYAPTVWSRPTTTGTNATFQGWEFFSTATGPNAPGTVPGPAFGGSGSWAPINPGGTANAFDSSAPGNGAFVTGGGNIYSPSGIVTPRIAIPNNIDLTAGNNSSGWTTLIVQIRTLGSVLDINTARLNGTIAPVISGITLDSPISGGFGGFIREYWMQFQVAGNADSYQFDLGGVETSVSWDRAAVDTIWNPTAANQGQAFLEPFPGAGVPEPSTWALIGIATLGAGGFVLRRHLQQRKLELAVGGEA